MRRQRRSHHRARSTDTFNFLVPSIAVVHHIPRSLGIGLLGDFISTFRGRDDCGKRTHYVRPPQTHLKTSTEHTTRHVLGISQGVGMPSRTSSAGLILVPSARRKPWPSSSLQHAWMGRVGLGRSKGVELTGEFRVCPNNSGRNHSPYHGTQSLAATCKRVLLLWM